MSSIIEITHLKKNYCLGGNTYHALKGVNLSIQKGELISIMGASGAGKSTLMNILGLLDSPTSGHYFLDNYDVSQLTDDDRSNIRNLKIGFVFQSFFLLPRLNVIQNVEMPLLYRAEKPHIRHERAMAMLKKVSMDTFFDRRPNELSGGQQQRVAIARALVGNPAVILADEPTGALDSKTSGDVMELFKYLNQEEGVTIIIVTHDPGVAQQCQRTVYIKDGLVFEEVNAT